MNNQQKNKTINAKKNGNIFVCKNCKKQSLPSLQNTTRRMKTDALSRLVESFQTTIMNYTDSLKLCIIPVACTEIPPLQGSQGNVVGDHGVPAHRVVDCPEPCQTDDVPDYQKMEVNRLSNDYDLLRLLAFSIRKKYIHF